MTTTQHATSRQPFGHTDAVVSLTDPHTYFCRECDRWVQQPERAVIFARIGRIGERQIAALGADRGSIQ